MAHLRHALQSVEIACVQNAYHARDRSSQAVLDECGRFGIAFVPYSPLGSGSRGNASPLDRPEVVAVAARLGSSPAQVVLEWALNVAPNVVLIPGTASRVHLRENLEAAAVHLDADAIAPTTAALSATTSDTVGPSPDSLLLVIPPAHPAARP